MVFFCGGSGGIGSLIYGGLADRDNIKAITVCTVETSPRMITLKGDEVLGLHHAYGTNGIVIDLTLPITYRKVWVEQIYAFNTLSNALDFSEKICLDLDSHTRLVTLLEAPICSFVKNGPINCKDESHTVIILVEDSHKIAIEQISKDFKGSKLFSQKFDDVEQKGKTLVEYTWNHTTLHAIKTNKDFTYLQTGYGNILEYRSKIETLRQKIGKEMILHLEYVKENGNFVVGGLPLIRYSSDEQLNTIINHHLTSNVAVANPHEYTTNSIRGINGTNLLKYKKQFDPYHLMNPGKLAINNLN